MSACNPKADIGRLTCPTLAWIFVSASMSATCLLMVLRASSDIASLVIWGQRANSLLLTQSGHYPIRHLFPMRPNLRLRDSGHVRQLVAPKANMTPKPRLLGFSVGRS